MIKKCIAGVLITLIFNHSMGCAFAYHPKQLDDKKTIEDARRIKLTTVENKEYILRDVIVRDDKITGYVWLSDDYSKTRGEFLKTNIAKIEVEEIKTGSTVLIIGGISVLIGVIFIMHSFTGFPFE